MIDKEGYRSNVGIILSNEAGQLLWAKRCGYPAWQFPQGGMVEGESPDEAMYRELYEEIGLRAEDVRILGRTEDWKRYKLPKKYIRTDKKPRCIGQKQLWFLLRLTSDETQIKLDHSDVPEFDQWRWIDYWYAVNQVIYFKKEVYKQALTELETLI